jgi:hypothetical protein
MNNLKNSKYFLSKIGNRMVKQVLSGDWYWWEGKDIRKGSRRLNVALCTHA